MTAIAAATKDTIGRLGGGFMTSREAKAYTEETGFAGWAPYMRGRCGVLGEVDAGVVASVVGFFPVDVVREVWDAGRSLPARDAAHRYAAVCQEYARRKLAGFAEADADRLAGLLQAVVEDADMIGAPLAAGWRAMPLPGDGRARAVQLAHVLRELRGGRHLVAVLSCGLTPLEAVLAGGSTLIPDGERNARGFGWPEPYTPPSDAVRKRRAEAEELTDTLVEPAFRVLSDSERDEVVSLLGRALEVAFG